MGDDSIWKELELFFRDPKNFQYPSKGPDHEKVVDNFKKAFSDDKSKAKQFLEDMKLICSEPKK